MKAFRITIITLLLCSFSITGFSQSDGTAKKKKPKQKQQTEAPAYNTYNTVWVDAVARVTLDVLVITIKALSKCHK